MATSVCFGGAATRVLALAVLVLVAATSAVFAQKGDTKFVGGYVLMSANRNGKAVGLSELSSLADNAANLPVTRVLIGFFDPTLVYVEGSHTLNETGLNASSTGDFGFKSMKQSIQKLKQSGVEVFLSLGGWNYNCFPYLYMRYSVGGYGTHTPNYWKIDQYGGGNMSQCNEMNQYCWVCEPPSEGTDLSDFSIFPTVPGSDAWQQAVKFVENDAKGNQTPAWHYEIVPGRPWTDPKTGIQVVVPGRYDFVRLNRDPYQDFVTLAKDLGVDGIDLDYEEFWHADYFKYGNGPWWLPQTVYKYAAITKTLMIHIQQIQPDLKLSTAASAVGAWSSNWWGGNLKTVMYYLNEWYPSLVKFMTSGANAGGINVMTYDLSNNPEFHECPEPNICTLSEQVKFYMQQYKKHNIPANVGYEIGTPAYPSPKHDPTHQLPLTKEELQKLTNEVQGDYDGGFFWELFKPHGSKEASPTETAQAICSSVLGDDQRCSGTVPSK